MMVSMGAKKVIVVMLNAVSNEARAADAKVIKHYVETGEIKKPEVKNVRTKHPKNNHRKSQ